MPRETCGSRGVEAETAARHAGSRGCWAAGSRARWAAFAQRGGCACPRESPRVLGAIGQRAPRTGCTVAVRRSLKAAVWASAPVCSLVSQSRARPGLTRPLALSRLITFFGQIGKIKEGKGKQKGQPKVWIYKDKQTGLPKGDATVSYEDPNGAQGAVSWFNDKPFEGKGDVIKVSIAERKANPLYAAGGGGGGGGGYRGGAVRPPAFAPLTFPLSRFPSLVSPVGWQSFSLLPPRADHEHVSTARGLNCA